MYIYNVTINVDDAVHEEWLTWMETHILDVLNTGKFISAKFTQIMVEEEMGGKSYAVQYTAKNKKDLEDYYTEDADALRLQTMQKFGDKILAFRTELKLIKEFYPTAKNN